MPCVQLARLNNARRHARRRKAPVARRAALGLCLLASLAGGCDFLLPLVLMEHKEKIPAEFDKLSGKRTAIVVWSSQETLFDYPHVRMELALHIADRIWSNIKDAEIVDGRKIEDYIQRTLSAAADPETIGKEFGCDYVVYLELLDFQMRDPDAPDFLRAHIGASVTVYDLKSGSDEPRRYDLADVNTVYPENNPLLFNDTNAVIVRKQAYEMFAEEIANKFYAHNVDM